MRIVVLASGSKGNSTYVEYQNTRILLDVGVSCLYITEAFKQYDINPKDIDAIIISHTHSDHIKGLKTFVHQYHPKVYLTDTMAKEIKDLDVEYEIIEEEFHVKDLVVTSIKTSHDVESYGYIVKGDEELVYLTDSGYIKESYFDLLKNKEYYVFESNHDIETLLNGKYPYILKQRILSDHGHLSNADSAYYLSKLTGNRTKCVCLAHLSEENNTEELAFNTLQSAFKKDKKKLPMVKIAKQNESTELVGV